LQFCSWQTIYAGVLRGGRDWLRTEDFRSGSPLGRGQSSLKYNLGKCENKGNSSLELLKGAHMGGLLSNLDVNFSVSC